MRTIALLLAALALLGVTPAFAQTETMQSNGLAAEPGGTLLRYPGSYFGPSAPALNPTQAQPSARQQSAGQEQKPEITETPSLATREVATDKPVAQTVSLLGKAAYSQGMNVVGYFDQGAPVSVNSDREVEARSILVENPRQTRKLLLQDPATAVVIPTRINVFKRESETIISYVPPSELLSGFDEGAVQAAGPAMDKEISEVVESVAAAK